MSTNNDNGNQDETAGARADAASAAAQMRDAAGEAAREFKEKVGELAGELKETAAAWQKELEHYVKKNPTKSVLAAVGVGFVLGVICRR